MTKINTWKCDICFKIYGPNDNWSDSNEPLDLYIPAPSQYSSDLKTKYIDTCGECREKIISFISNMEPKK